MKIVMTKIVPVCLMDIPNGSFFQALDPDEKPYPAIFLKLGTSDDYEMCYDLQAKETVDWKPTTLVLHYPESELKLGVPFHEQLDMVR